MKLNPNGHSVSILFSYKTPVAGIDIDGFFRTDKKWSVTTSRHIGKYVGSKCRIVSQEWIDSLIN